MTSATIHLQGVGSVAAIPAEQLQPGMRLMWNYGSIYEVISIAAKGAQSLSVVERNIRDSKEYTRTLRRVRLVAGYWPKGA